VGARVVSGDEERIAESLRDCRLTYCEHWISGDNEPCCSPCLRDRILASDWLASHVAAAKAEALREAADEMPDIRDLTSNGIDLGSVHRWLTDRAARIDEASDA